MLLLLTGQECWPWLLSLASTSPTVMQVFAESVGSGLRHIVPDGLDHIIFLLGLFFLSRNFAGLLFQVTLFTLAHSLTLGVVVMTGLAAPEQWVEVAVGLSIAVVAIEGFFVNRALTKLRPYLVALFGCMDWRLLITWWLRRLHSPIPLLPSSASISALNLANWWWWRRPTCCCTHGGIGHGTSGEWRCLLVR